MNTTVLLNIPIIKNTLRCCWAGPGLGPGLALGLVWAWADPGVGLEWAWSGSLEWAWSGSLEWLTRVGLEWASHSSDQPAEFS